MYLIMKNEAIMSEIFDMNNNYKDNSIILVMYYIQIHNTTII